ERDMAALRAAQLGLLVKLSALHKKADDGFSNFDESSQQQVFDDEFNNFDESSQQQAFDNEFNNFEKNNEDKNNKKSFGSELSVDGGNSQHQGKDNKAIANPITDQQLVKDSQPNAAQEINLIQSEYANKIAPTIQLFWQMQKQPQRIEGNHYTITLEENILTLTRKSGEKIAALSVDNSSPPQGFGLTESDLERFLDLQRILTERIKLQKQDKNRGIEY
ncbi:relaxase/mobilization nuclease, partial [Calothrix sp. UHCC 0171]|nr:relaxase/mobilization nuclease [Calothrix sp. UHCC 0171]